MCAHHYIVGTSGDMGTSGDIEENKISGELTYGEIILYPERVYLHLDHSLNV